MRTPLLVVAVIATAAGIGCRAPDSPPPAAGTPSASAAGSGKAEAQALPKPVYPDVAGALEGGPKLVNAAWSDATKSGKSVIFPADLEVPESLTFTKKIERHADILKKLLEITETMRVEKEEAKKKNSLVDYLAAEENEKNAMHHLAPYAVAEQKAQVLKSEGKKLKAAEGEWTSQVCNEQGACGETDPMTALFMILMKSIFTEFVEGKPPFGPNNDLIKFLQRPLGGPNSDLVKIREMLLGHDQNGEIAKLIRDPAKRPAEILQTARDAIIPPSENGDLAKVIRDPINCTIGKLFGGC